MRHPSLHLRGAFLLLLLTALAPAWAGADTWTPLAATIGSELTHGLDLYRQGQAKAARGTVTRAYFGLFEDRRMEAAMRTELGARYTYKVEKRFSALRRAIKAGVPVAELEAQIRELTEILKRDAGRLDAAGVPARVFDAQTPTARRSPARS